jgi:hypothetical protein
MSGPIDGAHTTSTSTPERYEGGDRGLDGPDSRAWLHDARRDRARGPGPRDRPPRDGLVRRTSNVHHHDRLILSEDECEAAQAPLRAILAHIEGAISLGAGTTEQIAERWAEFLEPGLIDHVALQLPAGDMTFDEARHTLELFAAEVKPRLEQASLAV